MPSSVIWCLVGLYGATSQKTVFFIVIVKTSNPTYLKFGFRDRTMVISFDPLLRPGKLPVAFGSNGNDDYLLPSHGYVRLYFRCRLGEL
jgi:hypothetical protein